MTDQTETEIIQQTTKRDRRDKIFQARLQNILQCASTIPYSLRSLLKLAQPVITYRDLTAGIK